MPGRFDEWRPGRAGLTDWSLSSQPDTVHGRLTHICTRSWIVADMAEVGDIISGHQCRPATPDDSPASPEAPLYRKTPGGNNLWMVTCDEGWRESIVGSGMYEWAADWLVGVLGRRPYAPETRP